MAATGVPVASTLMGLGTFPSSDPLSLGMLGMHGTAYANYAMDQVRVGWRKEGGKGGDIERGGEGGANLFPLIVFIV